MNKFRIESLNIGEYRIFLKIVNVDTNQIVNVFIPIYAFYHEEMLMVEKLEKHFPNNLFFETESLKEKAVKTASYDRIKRLVHNML